MKKLNIGSGKNIKRGCINLDICSFPGVDVIHNLETFPYPFDNEQFDAIFANQVLEHVDKLTEIMKELSRILKVGGKLTLDVPHFTSNSSYMDPTHKRLFAYTTFDFFVENHFKSSKYEYNTQYFSKIKKKICFYKGLYFYNYLLEPLINLIIKYGNGHLYEGNLLRNIFPAWKIEVELIK